MANLDRHSVMQYSPLTLAFLGDAVYEQLVRERLVLTANMPVNKLHKLAVERVRASYQSAGFSAVESVLTEDELAMFKRGRNAGGHTPPKSSDAVEYRRATGVECLFGYLHLLGDKNRIDELFEIIWNSGEEKFEN